MSSLAIRTRTLPDGSKRYDVRYRLGGRTYPVEHGGTFRTMAEAKQREKLVGGELAAGRNPRLLLAAMRNPLPVRTLSSWADAYLESRVDIATETRRNVATQLRRITAGLGTRDPQTLTHADVHEWMAGLALAPGSVKQYVKTLRQLLDYAGCDPNPARDPRVRLPRQESEIPNPPKGSEVAAIIANAAEKYRLVLRLLAESGMRVGEACSLTWGDVDFYESRLRVRHGKTRAARRWVVINDDLMTELQLVLPPDDRMPDRRVFQFSTKGVEAAMTRACRAAGVAHYTPHDLRHRWISVQHKRGVPVAEIAAHVGHSKTSLTLDTYTHVLLDDDV